MEKIMDMSEMQEVANVANRSSACLVFSGYRFMDEDVAIAMVREGEVAMGFTPPDGKSDKECWLLPPSVVDVVADLLPDYACPLDSGPGLTSKRRDVGAEDAGLLVTIVGYEYETEGLAMQAARDGEVAVKIQVSDMIVEWWVIDVRALGALKALQHIEVEHLHARPCVLTTRAVMVG